MNKKGITYIFRRQPMNKLERDEIFGKISRATKWMVNRYVLGTHPQTCLPPFIYLFIENLFFQFGVAFGNITASIDKILILK